MTITTSIPRRAAAGCLAAAAVAIELQILGGADYPTVPPGLIILAVAAVLVLLPTPRWTLALATVATAFISIGGVVAPNLRDQLAEPGDALAFAGSALQVVALLGALLCCALGLREAFGRASAEPH